MYEYHVWVNFTNSDNPLSVAVTVDAGSKEEAIQKAIYQATIKYPENTITGAEISN